MPNDPISIHTAWETLSGEEVLKKIESSTDGLSETEATKRRETHGPNRLPEAGRQSAWMRLLSHFNNVLIYVLLGAAVITALLGHWMDTAVILAVVVINALIGFFQEGKAEKALDAIRNMLSLEAVARRDGDRRKIPAEDLVPGDIIFLQSGDKIPADVRFLSTKSLRVEEAALTGESLAVDKSGDAVSENTPLGDRSGMGFSGTLVVSGQATAVVVETGAHTELGKINTMIAQAPTLTTPLLRQVDTFGKRLTVVILVASIAVFAFGITLGEKGLDHLFLAVVGLAVAAIPEGLPAILTIILALGVQRMAARNAIIRRLPAVETLGAVGVICSDKTGTLTRNEMTVASVSTPMANYSVTGSGYRPEGDITRDLEPVPSGEDHGLDELCRNALLCNDSRLREKNGQWVVEGDPTEGALLTVALKHGLQTREENDTLPREDVIPFESSHKFMATLHHDGDGYIAFIKGAPERILERCSRQVNHEETEDLNHDHWQRIMERIAAKGERLLALARKRFPEKPSSFDFDAVADGLELLGVCGLLDPPRDEAIEAIAKCRSAGVRVKMITGDHIETARAIGMQMGLEADDAVAGEEIDRTSDEDLPELAARTDIFARTTPEHKLRLVTALQKRNQIVAMTGDGVNDAPALKSADIGVAMGIKGTEAAKEASEMVLADDNFASIEHAVEEGRTVYDNLRKSILFILPTNGGQSLVIILAILFGLELPITPLQILWVNMITAVTLALALAFEPAETNVMQRPPRDPDEPLFTKFFLWRTTFVSVLLTIASLSAFIWQKNLGVDLEVARTMAVNTLIFGQIFYLLNSRFLVRSSLYRGLFTDNPIVPATIGLIVLAQIIFTYLGFMQIAFGTAAIAVSAWAPILVTGLIIFLLVELEKSFRRRWIS